MSDLWIRSRLGSVQVERFYFPQYERKDAVLFLEGKSTRSFVLRSVAADCLVVSYVKSDQTIIHHRVFLKNGRLVPDGAEDKYSTMHALLSKKGFVGPPDEKLESIKELKGHFTSKTRAEVEASLSSGLANSFFIRYPTSGEAAYVVSFAEQDNNQRLTVNHCEIFHNSDGYYLRGLTSDETRYSSVVELLRAYSFLSRAAAVNAAYDRLPQQTNGSNVVEYGGVPVSLGNGDYGGLPPGFADAQNNGVMDRSGYGRAPVGLPTQNTPPQMQGGYGRVNDVAATGGYGNVPRNGPKPLAATGPKPLARSGNRGLTRNGSGSSTSSTEYRLVPSPEHLSNGAALLPEYGRVPQLRNSPVRETEYSPIIVPRSEMNKNNSTNQLPVNSGYGSTSQALNTNAQRGYAPVPFPN